MPATTSSSMKPRISASAIVSLRLSASAETLCEWPCRARARGAHAVTRDRVARSPSASLDRGVARLAVGNLAHGLLRAMRHDRDPRPQPAELATACGSSRHGLRPRADVVSNLLTRRLTLTARRGRHAADGDHGRRDRAARAPARHGAEYSWSASSTRTPRPRSDYRRTPRLIDPSSPCRRAHAEQRAAAAAAKIESSRCARRVPRAVGRALVDGVRERVAEEQLAGVDDVAADVHLDVDVHGAAGVPAGVDRLEEREPVRVGALDPAQVACGRRCCWPPRPSTCPRRWRARCRRPRP